MNSSRNKKRYHLFSVLFLFLLTLLCCNQKVRDSNERYRPISAEDSVHFARGFRIETHDDYTLVSIINPWNAEKILKQFILVPKNSNLPNCLPAGEIVRTPLERTVCFGTVQCSFFAEIGVLETLVGVCESHFINNQFVRKKVEEGLITDIGSAAKPDIEQLMMIQPEALFTTPLDESSIRSSVVADATVIEGFDYMENTPLGRTEWIRFYALFFEKRNLADSLFAQTVTDYLNVKAKTGAFSYHPTVLAETVYNGIWWIPGGQSYMATLYRDAGAEYLWKDDPNTGSIGLSFETVLEKAKKSDFWLIKYNSPYQITRKCLADENSNYTLFDAFNRRKIYAVNTGQTSYYEELSIHPNHILEDLARVFHNINIGNNKVKYYIQAE